MGCGKTYLLGDYGEVGETKGSYATLTEQDDTLGVVLRTRSCVKPVFVSVGHKTTLKTARQLILNCAPRYRLPEPIRAADHAAGDF